MMWRKVPGLPDCYEVSDSGEMRRLARERRTRDGRQCFDPEVRLRGFVTDKGYRAFKGGSGFRHITAHRAVALAFLGPCPDGEEVCHIDGDKLNNCVSNLRYDTRTGNLLDRRINGVGAIHGESHNKTGLTDDDVRKIRALYWIDGQSTRQIAARYDIGHVTVWQIVSGRTWTHIAMPDRGNDLARENASLRAKTERLTAALTEAELALHNERGEGTPPALGWRNDTGEALWWRVLAGHEDDPDDALYVYAYDLADHAAMWERFRRDQDGRISSAASGRATTVRAAMLAADAATATPGEDPAPHVAGAPDAATGGASGVGAGLTNCDSCAHDYTDPPGAASHPHRWCAAYKNGDRRLDIDVWCRDNIGDHGAPLPGATDCPGYSPRTAVADEDDGEIDASGARASR